MTEQRVVQRPVALTRAAKGSQHRLALGELHHPACRFDSGLVDRTEATDDGGLGPVVCGEQNQPRHRQRCPEPQVEHQHADRHHGGRHRSERDQGTVASSVTSRREWSASSVPPSPLRPRRWARPSDGPIRTPTSRSCWPRKGLSTTTTCLDRSCRRYALAGIDVITGSTTGRTPAPPGIPADALWRSSSRTHTCFRTST